MQNRNHFNTRTLWLGYGACALAGCLWGTGFYFGRLALNEMRVEHMVLLRFLFACVAMAPAAFAYRARFTTREVKMLIVLATLGVPVQFLLQFHGLARTTVSHASLMVGSMPVLLAASASLFAHEKLDRIGWTAIFASALGAALIVLGGRRGAAVQGEPSLYGDLLVLASMATAIVWVLLSKKLMETHSSVTVSAYTILLGSAQLAVIVLAEQWALPEALPPPHLARFSATAWAALAASGFFCTAATTLLWNWGIRHAPASRAGVFLNIEPALGSWLGVQLLGERLGPFAGLGGFLILASAVVLTTRKVPLESPVLLD